MVIPALSPGGGAYGCNPVSRSSGRRLARRGRGRARSCGIGADAADAERLLDDRLGAGGRHHAPAAPQSVRNEATIRVAGALAQSDFGGIASESIGDRAVSLHVTSGAAAGIRFGAPVQWASCRLGE